MHFGPCDTFLEFFLQLQTVYSEFMLAVVMISKILSKLKSAQKYLHLKPYEAYGRMMLDLSCFFVFLCFC
jgi:hypothetical protein